MDERHSSPLPTQMTQYSLTLDNNAQRCLVVTGRLQAVNRGLQFYRKPAEYVVFHLNLNIFPFLT